MNKYELLKQEMLLLANELNIQKELYYQKSHNSGIFAAGLYKGHGDQADKVSQQIRQRIKEVEKYNCRQIA